mmetsp:Transcript_127777/g.246237  ORF Transcript_127777/g.246237 Transcript_127777/m.246237 type:complete len:205 (+) Transcript_127777:201-815(+)
MSGSAAAWSFCTLLSSASRAALQTSVMSSACFLSFASRCALASVFSFKLSATCASVNLFCKPFTVALAADACSTILDSSVFSSVTVPPVPMAAKSFDFVEMSARDLPVLACASFSFVANDAQNSLYFGYSSRYTVPPLPTIVTQPSLSFAANLQRILGTPSGVSFLGMPVASTTSPAASFAIALLVFMSNTSVRTILWTQIYLF